jgi:xanthine/uracil permease
MLCGYAAAAMCFGMVDFSGIASAGWFSLPKFLPFGVTFDPSACIAIGLLFAINSIQAIGDFTATTVGGFGREPSDRELQGGIIAYGATNILTALFGGLPTATYSQNVGIVTTNKVVNRTVFTLTGAFLLLAGVCPKFAAVLTTIPQCVLGGATITVFSTIAMTGMKLITSQDSDARNTTIVGLSAALGVGISQASLRPEPVPRELHHHLRQVPGGHRHADGGAAERDPAQGGLSCRRSGRKRRSASENPVRSVSC